MKQWLLPGPVRAPSTEARILGGAAQVIEIRPLMGRNQRDEGRLTGDTATGVAVRASLEAFSSGR